MNYIKQLEQERSELQEERVEIAQRIIEFKDHMMLDKFHHPNNYINVEDVRRWLRYIETGRN